jgi:hypothetical protein
MQKRLLCGIFLVTILNAMFTGSIFAGSITINDFIGDGTNSYWGGTMINAEPTDFGDVIGEPNYNVDTLMADQSADGNTTTVTLTGYYFYSYLNSLDNADIFTPGDLYISSAGWQVPSSGGPHYETDDFTQSEGWNYVIPFIPNGSGSVYNLDYNSIEYTNVNGLSGLWYYRTNQAWRGGYGAPVSSGTTVSLFGGTAANGYNDASLTFTFPSLGNPASMGYHWDMRCGNDIVEGGNPVPEPSTMLLLGTGLLGMLIARRRQFARM